jgi:Fic family protein
MLEVETHRAGPFIFQPGFDEITIQPFLAQVETAHRMATRMPAYSRILSALEKDTLVTGVTSTDTIEGGDVSDEEASRVLDNPELAQENRELRIVNLGRAYTRLGQYVHRYSGAPVLPFEEKYFRLIHRIVARGLTDGDYNPGKYRNNPKGMNTYVGDSEHGGKYKAPQAYDDICMLMNAFADWSSSEELAAVHPLIRAPLLHYYFERIHPFYDGNGRIGRLIEKAVLIHAGYSGWARALDAYYLRNIDKYYTLFNVCRKAQKDGKERCNESFLVFALMGMVETIERHHEKASKLAERMLQLAYLGDLLREKKINHRQHAILELLMDAPRELVPTSEIKSQLWYRSIYKGMSAATESRDWSRLEELGFVKRRGRQMEVRNRS